ncbi:NEL-type E3 ubiquitin ligase domain-containing protein [Pseudomonas sp. TSRC2-2]|uniref:NEL-type E3 ubiquitin ligase domain-containing protein n=1 Tax=unclassified Pseudomonas TaxID=196821 RepID=UPI003CE72A75
MSPDSPLSQTAQAMVTPVATESVHAPLLEAALPQWLIDAPARRKAEVKQANSSIPDWYAKASPTQRDVLHKRFNDSFQAQVQLDKTMSSFKDIDAFARPLLLEALKSRFQVQVDVDKTLLCLKRPVLVTIARVEVGTFEVLTLPLLQAALHNFESEECKYGAFHKSSTFAVQNGTPGHYKAVPVNVSVRNFLSLCRELDIGAKYQAYLRSFFHPADPKAEAKLRRHFILAQKTALHAAAEQALLTKAIRRQDHAMILSVLQGNKAPRLDNKIVSFQDLSLMNYRLVGCIVFVIYDRFPSFDEVILYVPNDPAHPLKRYTGTQMQDTLKRLLSARDPQQLQSTAPTAYQQFFSQFLPYKRRAEYFSQFVKPAHPASDWLRSASLTTAQIMTGLGTWETPPEVSVMIPDTDPFVAASPMPDLEAYIKGRNNDLWTYLYEKHRDKVFGDARSHAVPTEDVDAKARDAKLAVLLQFGLLAVNVVAMFVPVLGEAMMAVMAGQLLLETIAGVVEWSEGDKHAAKAHLVDVAENLALMGAMAAAGAGFNRLMAVKPEPLIESLHPVTLANGKTRLWKPDFSGYEQDVTLGALSEPNALAQYSFDGRTFIRQGGKIYEQVQDEATAQWLLKHPTDPDAYRPVLVHNGHGAWRLALEQPMTWERLDLLRRMGPVTDGFSDDSLLMLADISGVSDNTLRKMHMDHLPPPPELRDAMSLFEADAGARQMIEQLRGARTIDERFLYALPLIPEMPRWPAGRVLEIVTGSERAAKSIRYGAQNPGAGIHQKPSIRLNRAHVMNGEMPARILAALEEDEIIHLLGSKGAQFRPARPDEFMLRLAEYAYTRQAAIFDSLYTGTQPMIWRARILHRECPGLGQAAAQDVLDHATLAQLSQMDATGRSPLKLLEEARWHARQGRQLRAFAGLHSENLASAASRRLALFALEQLPEWTSTLHLQIREGSITGALLDSIGEPAAPVKRYLVKNGPFYQAFDQRGLALNRVSRVEESFYSSLVYALPDDLRATLGLDEGSSGRELQHRIIESAHIHRLEAARVLEPQAPWFKPPVRVAARLHGYYASGRGRGFNQSLDWRVTQLYPQRQQADAFFAQQRGRSDAQIHAELRTRQQDWDALNTSLDQWLAGPTDGQTAQHRTQLAQALRSAWRNAPLAGQLADAARLSLICDTSLPVLNTRFAHVHELSLTGIGVTDANADGFLAAFPNLTDLSIGEPGPVYQRRSLAVPLTTLPPAVGRLPRLTRLRFSTDAPLLAQTLAPRLRALTSLETLHIDYSGTDATTLHGLDLAPLTQLRTLRIDAPRALWQWPAYAERLERLGRLNLTNTLVEALPESLYQGHEQLWAGLSLDWSRVTPATFRRAYDYVSHYSGPFGHLLDVHQMVREFCRAELDAMAIRPGVADPLAEAFFGAWATAETRVEAIEDLRAEHEAVFAQFYAPALRHGTRYAALRRRWSTGRNADMLNALRASWHGTIRRRYGLPASVETFELPVARTPLSLPAQAERLTELPSLPAGSFAHVRTLRLARLDVPLEQARSFLRAFSQLESLAITQATFTELPFTAHELPALTHLDMSDNRVAVTPLVQRHINGLQRLQRLDLSHNPLDNVDVGALRRLRALNLRSTSMQTWPGGAEHLRRLTWLDLRDNRIASLPPSVLSHPDMLMRTNLTGNLFDLDGEAAFHAALHGVEKQRGLQQGTLLRFAAQPVPEPFPPSETGCSFLDLLLPLPEPVTVLPADAVASAHVQRLSAIMPRASAEPLLDNWRATGWSDGRIEAQISVWHRSCEDLNRQLNDWLYIREVRTQRLQINAQNRSFAARRIREAWLDGLIETPGRPGLELEFEGLQTGDLPALSVQLPAVTTLDLSGVGMTVQGCDGFLAAFPSLDTLYISGNELTALPGPVLRMRHLQRLHMQYCDLQSATSLYPLVLRAQLRHLDIGYNDVRMFNPPDFGVIETLDLRYNRLSEWPVGVLQAPRLRDLNLSGNEIADIPVDLFNGTHAPLIDGIDLSENQRLSLAALQELRRYAREHASTHALGVSSRSINSMIDARVLPDPVTDAEPTGNETSAVAHDPHAVIEPVEVVFDPAIDVAPTSLDPWLRHSSPEVVGQRRTAWAQLAREPNHERFFQLLRLLRDTEDFRLVPADLSRRMWDVVQAATENTELRQLLFKGAETHGTCVDGRILTFSDLQVRVAVYRTLHDIPLNRVALRGRALVRLSRQLFRLDRVEVLAEAAAQGLDRAEVRLKYRIRLTRGWGDGIELPGQPAYMLYDAPLSDERLMQIRASILEAEQTDALPASMIERDYWSAYLQERYPQEMRTIDDEIDAQREQLWTVLDDRLARGEIDAQQYDQQLSDLGRTMEERRRQKRIALTRREIIDLQSHAGESELPGRLSPTPGPSSRP